MNKYVFSFYLGNTTGTKAIWAKDLMEATAEFYETMQGAVITNSERTEA